MGTRTLLKTVVMGVTAAALLAAMFSYSPLQTGSQKDPGAKPGTTPEIDGFTLVKGKKPVRKRTQVTVPKPQPIPDYINRGISWLVEAQHSSGGWGAGSHSNQRNLDPSKVKLDPATTAFAGMALLRAGHTPNEGTYRDSVRKATSFLVTVVEDYNKPGPRITDMTGTQPQAKLGQLVDTTMTTHFLSRLLTVLPKKDPLHDRVSLALDKCLVKIQGSQQEDGSWSGGGWASVLQSSLGTTALELAQVAGKQIDTGKLAKARRYQKGNFNVRTGSVDASAGAGVALYAFAGAQRAGAGEARAARDLIATAKEEGQLGDDAPVSEANLRKIGLKPEKAKLLADADKAAKAQIARLDDESLLRGFGNNGGEEFLSYLMTSESLVITGGDAWKQWNQKINARLSKVQNPDGSWNGHHCISSPVFCTAAVVQCATTDHDAGLLIQIAERAAQVKDGAGSKTVSNR